MIQTSKWVCALVVLACVTGCSTRQMLTTLGLGTAAGVGATAGYYAKGDLEADHDRDINHVYQAALSTMEERGYRVTAKDVSDASARIEATIPATGSEKDRGLTIKLERKEQNLTGVSIRVGVFGDEPLSRAVLDDIHSRL